MKKFILVFLSLLLIAGTGASVYYLVTKDDNSGGNTEQTSSTADTTGPTLGDEEPSKTDKQLLYLIEEEKLAHDIYVKMNEKWQLKIFGNILQSETTHQNRVLNLLNLRDLQDPRSGEIGVFKDESLQKLYNELLAKGQKSKKDSIEVGKIIEAKDIKDITDILSNATATDVITTLEDLRRASENHLRAFNAQF